MPAEAMKAWPIGKIAEKDCLLFMWTSSPHLNQAIALGEAWGFAYKTVAFVWHKQGRPNPGHYTMSECELCLVFKRGNIPSPRGARNVRQFVSVPRGVHSAKPEEVMARIEAMFPTQRKLELFSRRNRPGWETWGSEVGKLDPSQDNASVPADKPSEAFPPFYLTSLHGVPGKKRLTALTRHIPEDECYTEQDLMACGLKAAGRTQYDVDVCTMNATGTYPAATGKRRTVDGKTVEARFTGVPAHRHYTKNSSQWGSLDLPWCGDLVWCNPPYGDRLWATFMEKANHEVEVGNAGVVVCVTNASGADLTCWANGVVLTANAFEIRLEATDLPFFKDHKGKVESNKGTRFVLYGKGEGFRAYVLRFIDEVERAGYVGGAWAERLRSQARTMEVAPAPTNQFDAMAAKAHKTQGAAC